MAHGCSSIQFGHHPLFIYCVMAESSRGRARGNSPLRGVSSQRPIIIFVGSEPPCRHEATAFEFRRNE